MVDLTTKGASGTIDSASFEQISPQSTGTGVIDSFVRLKANGQEAAYNTGANLAKPFNQHGGAQYNRDLLLTSVPIVNVGGIASYQFLLDINQVSNDKNLGNLLSLNQLQVFRSSTPSQNGGSWDRSTGYFDKGGMDLNVVWDMNPGGGTANWVTLNYELNPGSGAGDMFFYLPTKLFSEIEGQYVVLYSEFGSGPGTYSSNAGFEEWAVLRSTPIPEPTTLVAGALLLLPFGASLLGLFRPKRDSD